MDLSAQQPSPSPNLAGIAHVAIRVSNLDASVAFYEKLGFVQAFALSRDGKVYEAFIKINDRQFLELYPATPKDAQIGFLHLCFEGNDLHAVHDFYITQGLAPTEVRTAGAGNLLFTMAGPVTPTGRQNLEYTQYMPGSLHSKDFGQHLGPHRVSERLIGVEIASEDPGAARAFYLQKMGFSGGSAGSGLTLPGNATEGVEIVPLQPLGFKARITLAADPGKVSRTLTVDGVPFSKSGKDLLLADPDGNEIVLGQGVRE